MLHPAFFTPEQLARADELAGDLTLATGDAAADTRERMLRELRDATEHYQQLAKYMEDCAYLDTVAVRMVQAKNRWIDAYGALPKL